MLLVIKATMPAKPKVSKLLEKAREKAKLERAKRLALLSKLTARAKTAPATRPSIRGGRAAISTAQPIDAAKILASLVGRESAATGSYNANEQRARQMEQTIAGYQTRITEMERQNRETMERIAGQIRGLREAYVGGAAPMQYSSGGEAAPMGGRAVNRMQISSDEQPRVPPRMARARRNAAAAAAVSSDTEPTRSGRPPPMEPLPARVGRVTMAEPGLASQLPPITGRSNAFSFANYDPMSSKSAISSSMEVALGIRGLPGVNKTITMNLAEPEPAFGQAPELPAAIAVPLPAPAPAPVPAPAIASAPRDTIRGSELRDRVSAHEAERRQSAKSFMASFRRHQRAKDAAASEEEAEEKGAEEAKAPEKSRPPVVVDTTFDDYVPDVGSEGDFAAMLNAPYTWDSPPSTEGAAEFATTVRQAIALKGGKPPGSKGASVRFEDRKDEYVEAAAARGKEQRGARDSSRRITTLEQLRAEGQAEEAAAEEERVATAARALEFARGVAAAHEAQLERSQRAVLQVLDKAGQRAEEQPLRHKRREGDAVFAAGTAGVRLREGEAAGAPPTYSDDPAAQDPFV